MPCLWVQLQQKIQLDYKTNSSLNRQKIKLCGGLTTKDLKKPPSSRRLEGQRCGEAQRGGEACRSAELQNEWSHIRVWWIKIGRDTSGARDPRPRPDHPAQGFSTRKVNPHNFWLKNQWGLEQRKKQQDSQETFLKGPAIDLGPMQTHPFWDSAPGQQLEGHQWDTRRNRSDWQQGECQDTASSQAKLQKPVSGIVPSPDPPQHRSTEQ